MISIVMPVYNGSAYLTHAIESIRWQTFSEFELIVVDDGSTDDTAEIALAQAAQDRRIRVIHSHHAGNSAARNIGGQTARYPWIAVMDADDVALPERLEKQLAAVTANPRIVALGTAVYHMTTSGKVLSVSQHGPASVAEFEERRRTGADVNLNHPTALLKREVWKAVGGYDVRLQACVDFEMFDRMAEYGPILALTEPLLYYRIHHQSISMQRFFAQRMGMRYITARNQARVSGAPPKSFEEFMAACRQQPLTSRLRRRADDLSYYHYRKAGLYYGEEDYLRALFHIGISTILRPDYALPRLWRQRLSAESRQRLVEISR
jgi:glycosyltransferase involved in cell wall biosynthesis